MSPPSADRELPMRHRIVSSRVLVKAHPTHIYKFLENLENHKTLWPGVSRWEGDKESARYRWQLGLFGFNVETKIVERIPGIRVCEEPVSGAPFAYRRYFKIQADDQSAVLEVALEGDMSPVQIALFQPIIKAQFNATLKNIKTAMEKAKETAAPRPASATPASVAATSASAVPAPAGAPAATPAPAGVTAAAPPAPTPTPPSAASS
jgi:hypothetical protein